jgi:aerobic carbon-monoxide dehydrogenase medium subunit
LKDFIYECPATIEEAVAAMQVDGARALAGGTDLIPQLREGRRQAGRIVDLKRIPELMHVSGLGDGGIVLGAAANMTSVARHAAVADSYPAIAQSARLVGSLQVQNRASLGGNICNAAPSADAVPALICHQARARITGTAGHREEVLESLIRGPGKTSLLPGELLLSIVVPPTLPRSAAKYLRFTPRREMDIAIAGAAAWLRIDAMGVIAEARIVLASVGPGPIRAASAEHRMLGERPTPGLFEAVGRLAANDARPISDTRASADYRRSLVAVLTARALEDCCAAVQTELERS